jgi:hypothetical protein
MGVRSGPVPSYGPYMTDDTNTPAKPAPRKTAVKKAAPAKKEFAPTITEKGSLDHTNCGHPRDPKGRAACRAQHASK